ncbi:MAG: hypothetical protein ACYDB8_09040 [Acidiferrobacterales bacterium]
MIRYRILSVRLIATLFTAAVTSAAYAHAIAGMRVFPATMSFDDPGVADEGSWVFSHIDNGGTSQDTLNLAFAKRITRKFGVVASTDYQQLLFGNGVPTAEGLDNTTVAGSYQLFVHSGAESIGMVQFADSIGHSGSRSIGAPYSVYTPEFAFGKGFGGLSHPWRMLRPTAFTGAVSENFPTDPTVPHTLDWSFSLQYSIPYLQDFVRDVGIKGPFRNMVPIIEVPMQTCLDRGCANQTTGYINPGVIWVGHDLQWGIEAQVPVNSRTGNSVGILVGMDFYFDDIAPHSLGAPLFH